MLINTKDGLPNGVEEDRNTLSVFSISNYANTNNKGGMLKVNKKMTVAPYILNSTPGSKGTWVGETMAKTTFNYNSSEM
jgi:hypothetical protein